ncbi:hypothetical protein D3C84_975030 [compost metagenome]
MLHLGDVFQQSDVRQLQVGVLEPTLCKQVFNPSLGLARIDAVTDSLRCYGRLTFEAVDHGLYRRCLISLRLEFKFHRVPLRCI